MVTPPRKGYVAIILMIAVLLLSIGLMVAVPVWQTELKREKEEELIFRGKQYVEAVRVFQTKNPGRFPSKLKELAEKKCIRKLFKEPMTANGEWNLILNPGRAAVSSQPGGAVSQVLVVPESALDSIQNPMILGVVSPSKEESIRIYNDEETYDRWLFFYGQDPKKLPKIVYYGEEGKER